LDWVLVLFRAPGLVWAQVWDLVVVRVAWVLERGLAQVWAKVRVLASALVAALVRVWVQGWVLEGSV
jgi:hypothetical protein